MTPEPYCLIAELTYRCPLQCPYCSNPLEMESFRNEIDTAGWKRVIQEAAELGIVQLHLTGGEPLVRRDIDQLVATARDAGLYSHLITAGVNVDENRLRRLREAGLDAIQISIQDTRPEANDRLAGSPSFAKKEEAFRAAKQVGFAVTLNVVVHRHNIDRVREMIELARDWNADRLEIAHVQYTGWAFANRDALLPTREQLQHAQAAVDAARGESHSKMQMIHVLPDYYQDVPKACMNGWGRVFMTINPDGAILPCQTARSIPNLEFPNVSSMSLRDAWHSPVFEHFRGTEWMPEPCRSCDRREIDFGGCRCQAFLLTGDAAATDPVCGLSPHRPLVDSAIRVADSANPELQYRRFGNTPGHQRG